MRSPLQRLSPLVLSLIAGCYNSDAFDKLSAHDSSSSTSSNPETATSVVSVTVSASGTGASTSGSGVDSSTAEGGDPEDEPTSGTTSGSVGPTVSLTVDPPILQLAGPVEFTVEHSADAVRFELWDAIDNEHFQTEWLKGQKPPPYLITQGAPGETRSLTLSGRLDDFQDTIRVEWDCVGAQDEDADGCACRSRGTSPGSGLAGWLGLGLLGAWRRRRRRAARS